MNDDLLLVVGRDDVASADDGSLVLCRSCFESDQASWAVHFTIDTHVFAASRLWPTEPLECEGHRCCHAYHGQDCAGHKKRDRFPGEDLPECLREGIYDERRKKTRETLRNAVIFQRLNLIERAIVISFGIFGAAAGFAFLDTIKRSAEGLMGPIPEWGWAVACVVFLYVSVPPMFRYLMLGTIRKKVRLPK